MKVPEIYLKGKKDPGLVDFMDYTMIILNNGLYQMRTISTVPGWIANEGESLLYSSEGVRRCYYYIDAAWRYIQWGVGSSLSLIADSDYDTYVDVEQLPDEDMIHFSAGGTEMAVADSTQIALATGVKLSFEGISGDTSWSKNASSGYLEGYVDGVKRIEL